MPCGNRRPKQLWRSGLSSNSHPDAVRTKDRVKEALADWPHRDARRELVGLCTSRDLEVLNAAGYALARCGASRRDAADEFLQEYENDRRIALRTTVLYARSFQFDKNPRAFVREMSRVASLPGRKPWVVIMEELYWMWSRAPRDMFRLMTPWLTHRDPWRRWAALHGLEVPARTEPRSALKVLRVLRGERHIRVRRLLGHVLGQSLYPLHPEHAMDEMAQWLVDGARAASPVVRHVERQVAAWFESGMGTERQRRRLLRISRDYTDHFDPDVRAHARRLVRILEGSA
jgi:hypothetical protein